MRLGTHATAREDEGLRFVAAQTEVMSRRHGRSARALLGATLACAAILCARTTPAQPSIDPAKAAKVKAAYLLNFVRYTTWPETTFERPDSPIVVTMVGTCDAADVLEEVVRRAPPVEGRRVVLSRAALPGDGRVDEAQLASFVEAARRSHLLYVCTVDGERARGVLERLRGAAVLTVGDGPNFANAGGMLGFVLREDRIVFEANLDALNASGVSMSAKVLKLAKIVGGMEH